MSASSIQRPLRITANVPSTALQKRLVAVLNNNKVMREAHQLLGELCNPYVPMKSGNLRLSMKAYPKSVRWEVPYAKYQYEGEVWGPNKPIYRSGSIVGWKDIPISEKSPTGRELGLPGFWRGWTFGYTTEGTKHHWFDEAMANGGKRTYSIRVTNMLKQEAKRLNRTW